MAAFLIPFSRILGLDVKYRGGFSFSDLTENVSNNVERHQWIEITFRPSMEIYICDVFKEGVHNSSKYLTLHLDEAYNNHMYFNGKLIINTQI